MPKTILIIDDDELFRNILRSYLSEAGYEIELAADGHAGMHYIDHNNVDLIILDIQMPFVNGLDFLSRIRKDFKFKAIPVLMLSGKHSKSVVTKAAKLGISEFLIKPPQKKELLKRVDKLLAEKSDSQSAS